ncbi:hypothetical protein [Myroides odoratimimus]|uniref:hypothetical protein n=1 Tax=Myroides odoratimimus TaxID=76832 RepID=UPI00310166F6
MNNLLVPQLKRSFSSATAPIFFARTKLYQHNTSMITPLKLAIKRTHYGLITDLLRTHYGLNATKTCLALL